MADLGFIVHPTYRIESGRPVVHLWGRLENGETFLIRDDRDVPGFWIESSDAEQAGRLGATRIEHSAFRTFDGEPVSRIQVGIPQDAPALRDRLLREGIVCFEADVPFVSRYLMSRNLRGSLRIDGPWRKGKRVHRIYENPETRSATTAPALTLLSIDIETDPRGRKILSIALYGCGAAEVLVVAPSGRALPECALRVRSQSELLSAFCRRVRELDPDVITGWNVVDFDLQVLLRAAPRVHETLDLGRGRGQPLHLRPARSPWQTSRAIIEGRAVLDGIDLLRGSFIRMERYSLDFVAREVLGEGKTLTGKNRVEEILHNYQRDLPRFVEYNLNDARLVSRIFDRLQLLELSMERSRLTGMPLERVGASIASLDFLYLPELHRRGRVAPSVDRNTADNISPNLGGAVLESAPGLHDNVLVFDFKSLYPSIIRTFHIDPLGYVSGSEANRDEAIEAPNGARFRRDPGILPEILADLFPQREKAKLSGAGVVSNAIKILMNSFYGVLGAPGCRFYRPEIAAAITAFGRDLLLWSRDRIEEKDYRVLYGDTDSLFVATGLKEAEEALDLGPRLAAELNSEVRQYIQDRWHVESHLELELECLYLRIFFPLTRHGSAGARKRYAGRLASGEDVFTGLEAVRSDSTELARRVQRELFQRLFDNRSMDDYLRKTVAALRDGEHDDLLVYRKALRKALDEYTSTTPPHVAAARKLSRPAGRYIEYLITVDGPEPAEERSHTIDHEHYVQKQIRPVAEPILKAVGLFFDQVVGDETQLRLF